MLKPFWEALHDGFRHIRDMSDRTRIHELRQEGIQIDTDGIWEYSFGDHKEYDLSLEPFGEENMFLIALYKNGILLIPKLTVWAKKD